MSSIRLGLVQMHCPKGEIAHNLAAIGAYLRDAAARQTDIVCFPEMSLTGYIDPVRMPRAVLRLDSESVEHFAALTAGTNLTAIAGIVEANPAGKPFITQLVAQNGRLLGVYRKNHIAPDEEASFAPGTEMPVFHHGAVTFGVTVCADIDCPELFAHCAGQGAQIVFEAAAPGLYGEQATRNWHSGFAWWQGECETKLARYARDNGIWIAVATQAGRTIDEDFPGGGYLFDPTGRRVTATRNWSPGILYAEAEIG